MNPDHLLDQADMLVQASPGGAPRQADLRRAVSAAYYAMFHFVLSAAADMIVGKLGRRASPDLYARVYRATDHADLRKRFGEQRMRNISANIKAFADAILALQLARHEADYDPIFRVNKADAIKQVQTARDAINAFETATPDERTACLTLLLFKGRQ